MSSGSEKWQGNSEATGAATRAVTTAMASAVANPSLNGDLLTGAVVRTAHMDWAPSPSPSVHRKRVFLFGPPEVGAVTSVVRYAPSSSFHAHGHPQGEEFLVLEGTFSDDSGDYPAGSYLLNPEGFEHAPRSELGCVILVRLRQHPGTDRRHVAVQTRDMPWLPTGVPGASRKTLFEQEGYSDVTSLLQLDPSAALTSEMTLAALLVPKFPGGEQVLELFVVEGVVKYNAEGTGLDLHTGEPLAAGTWLRSPPGVVPALECTSETAAVLYVRQYPLPNQEGS